MNGANSDPIEVLRWVLEKVSPADVVGSSARESFQQFLRRGTVPQLRQLLPEIHEAEILLNITEARECSRSASASNSMTALMHPDEGQGRKRKRKQFFRDSGPFSRSHRCKASLASGTLPPSPSSMNTLSPSPSQPDSLISSQYELESISSFPERVDSDDALASTHGNSPFTTPPICNQYHIDISEETDPFSEGLIPAQSENVLWRAKQFFAERLGDRQARLDYLFRAVQGLVEAPELAPDFTKNMWKSRSAIFNKPSMPNTKARLRSLYNGHRTIKRAREQYLYAARFCYIYLEHDLDELSKSRDLILSQGRGRITAAFELQAEIISTTVDIVKAERKAGRGYLQILMEGGPGFILRLGSNVSTIWERKLSTADIRLIIEFLIAEAPVLYKDIMSYNEIATRALVDGFIAYGWSAEEILASETSLFKRLREFANLEEILQSAERYGTCQSSVNTLLEMNTPDVMQNQEFCSLDEDMLSTPHSSLSLVTIESVFGLSMCTDEELEVMNSLSQTRDEELDLLLSQEMEYSTDVCWTIGDENSSNLCK